MKIWNQIFLALLFGTLAGSICLTSCEKKVKNVKSVIDSSAVIEAGLDHLFKTEKFAPDFYVHAVKIVRSSRVPKELKFLISGKQVELVPKREGAGSYVGDLNHPMPFVDVTKLIVGPGTPSI